MSIDTVCKGRRRDSVVDASYTAHRLQTTLNAAQEERVIPRRSSLLLPLDDLPAVMRDFIEPSRSRSALDRLLRRRGHSRLPKSAAAPAATKPFKDYVPGFVHIDVQYRPQMADESARRYVFVAIDRATRGVFIAIKPQRTAAAAKSFLAALNQAAPMHITKVLTNNGAAFTDRLFRVDRSRDPSGEHEFDWLCTALGIEHRLTRPRHPQTNGMVERFNGRLEPLLRTPHFRSADDLQTTLHRSVWLYNEHRIQKNLDSLAPIAAMRRWQQTHPGLFKKAVRNHPGPDA